MPFVNYQNANNTIAQLGAFLWWSGLDTTIVLKTWDWAQFPSTFPYICTIFSKSSVTEGSVITKREIVRVDGRTWDQLTVVRWFGETTWSEKEWEPGYRTQGNLIFSFDPDDFIYLGTTDEELQDIKDELIELDNNKLNIVDYQNGTAIFAASSTGNDDYAINIIPAPSWYQLGQRFRFQADVANVWSATLNVSGLWPITIKKQNDQDLETWDIEAGQIVWVDFDWVNFQMETQVAILPTAVTDNLQKDYTALEDIFQWDAVYVDPSWQIGRWDASDPAKSKIIWVARLNILSGNTGTVILLWLQKQYTGLSIWSTYNLLDLAFPDELTWIPNSVVYTNLIPAEAKVGWWSAEFDWTSEVTYSLPWNTWWGWINFRVKTSGNTYNVFAWWTTTQGDVEIAINGSWLIVVDFGPYTFTSTTAVNDGSRHMVSFYYNFNWSSELWIDSVSEFSQLTDINNNSWWSWSHSIWSFIAAGNEFVWEIDELLQKSWSLSQAQVDELYNSWAWESFDNLVLTTNIRSYFDFNYPFNLNIGLGVGTQLVEVWIATASTDLRVFTWTDITVKQKTFVRITDFTAWQNELAHDLNRVPDFLECVAKSAYTLDGWIWSSNWWFDGTNQWAVYNYRDNSGNEYAGTTTTNVLNLSFIWQENSKIIVIDSVDKDKIVYTVTNNWTWWWDDWQNAYFVLS